LKKVKKRNPRIMLILTEFPPKVGGMQTHALYLSKHLSSRGYDIEVVTYHPEDEEERDAVLTLDEKMPFPVHRCMSRIGYWNNIDTLTDLGKRFRPDIVYSSTVFYGIMERNLGVPVICRSVGNDIMRPWIAYPFRIGSRLLCRPAIEKRLYNFFKKMDKPEWLDAFFIESRRRLMEYSARKATKIFANSLFTARLLRDIGISDDKIEVVVGGVDSSRFNRHSGDRVMYRKEFGLPEDRYIITTACRFVEKKGIDFLLRSFAILHNQMPDSHLVIIGSGRHFDRYRLMAGEIGIDECVTFAGSVPHDMVHKYFWCADLFVLASRVYVNPRLGIRDAETMGRVLCEANAAGIPVVASRSGGIPSVINHGENGLLFEPDDSYDLIRKIRHIRDDSGLARKLTRKGRRMAFESFDWSVILRAHERVFAEILS
jgi:phosphatidyl-myo-inositol dimannoside synthase